MHVAATVSRMEGRNVEIIGGEEWAKVPRAVRDETLVWVFRFIAGS